MDVRPATALDLDALAEVHVRSWQETYPGQMPQEYLDSVSVDERRGVWADIYDDASARVAILVLVDEETVVGFTRVCASRDTDAPDDVGEVASIYLLDSHSGRGGGRALMDTGLGALAEHGFVEATLWVFATNAKARRFYEANGWRLDGAEKRLPVGDVHISEVRYRRSLT
jgi:ribosomal protein S18 acetylase RimI-like enzyme